MFERMFEPTKAPWIRPGVVIHEASSPVDALLSKFAQMLRERGFRIAGTIQREIPAGGGHMTEVFDLADCSVTTIGHGSQGIRMAAQSLRAAMREDMDLVILSQFPAFEVASREMLATIEESLLQGMPVLTSLPGSNLQRWLDFAGQKGTIMMPSMRALWQWWGPERLYSDLAQGVADVELKQLVYGPRWLMIQGPEAVGLAYLPRKGKETTHRLDQFARMSLRDLAGLVRSWDPLEMAVGVAAINAHYNREDLGAVGNGTGLLQTDGRVVVIGAFPGVSEAFPNAQVIENEPRPGEYPTAAMDSLLPGSAAAVVSSSAVINRTLPRILRLAQGSRVGLIGPTAPLSDRLHHYGVDVIGGFVVRDADGLANAIRAGALPREFAPFGHYRQIAYQRDRFVSLCRYRSVSAGL